MTRTSRFVLVCALGLVSDLATAAPSTPTKTPSAATTCAAPDESKCLEKGYLDSACGRMHKAVCKPIIERKLEEHHKSSRGPKVKMLAPHKQDIPANLEDGKRMSTYSGPKGKNRVKVAGKHVLARTKLTAAPADKQSDPANAHRNPAWEKNGDRVTSCQEFGYESLYDWARFTDASAACAGDVKCIVEIALMPKTPGIGDRKLKSKNGKDIGRWRDRLPFAPSSGDPGKIGSGQGAKTKNDLFSFGGKFVYAGGPSGLAKSADLDTLRQVLDHGEKYFVYGGKCDDKAPSSRAAPGTATGRQPCTAYSYRNEWDFHRAMFKKNGKLSEAEYAEYERRTAQFRTLVDEWMAATFVARKKMNELGRRGEGKHDWVSPIDVVTRDPMERTNMLRNDAGSAEKAAKKIIKQLGAAALESKGAGIDTVPVGKGAAKHGALSEPRPSALALGVLAAPSKPTKGAKAGTRRRPKIASECGGFPKPDPKDANAVWTASWNELLGHGPAACRLGEFLRGEWERKARGQKSCLDLDNDDCDWTPRMVTDRFAAGVPYIDAQQAAEEVCRQYTGGTIDVATLDDAAKYIRTMHDKIGKAMEKLEPYKEGKTDKGWKLGESFVDAESMGDKEWFAAGYDYDLGWDVQPVKLDKQRDDRICELTGGAHGSIGVDGWLVGNHVPVVDGLVRGRVNKDGKNETHVEAHLTVFDKELLTMEKNFKNAYHHAWTDEVQIPTGYKPSFTVMAGPVPITGAVWGELFYGAEFKVRGVPKSAPCNANNVKFTVDGEFMPEIGLNAKAQVGVGISGLLSAGIRGMVNLVTIGLPLRSKLTATLQNIQGNEQAALRFSTHLDLSLATLSGFIALYIEFLLFSEEWELFRWSGVSSEIELMDLETELPLVGMR